LSEDRGRATRRVKIEGTNRAQRQSKIAVQIVVKQSRIEERGVTIEERGVTIEERGITIEERSVMIEERGMTIEERGVTIEERGITIEERSVKIADLEYNYRSSFCPLRRSIVLYITCLQTCWVQR